MIYVRACDQVRIAVYDWNPGGKETVLLIHGWPLSHEIFEYQTEPLLQSGYRVVSLDLRGFGNSDVPCRGYGYDQMADDIRKVVGALNLRQFTLAGFSMGGAVALRYMNRFGGFGVKKLALLAAAAPRFTQAAGFPYGVTRESVDALIAQASADRPQMSREFSRRLLFGDHSEAVLDWFENISLSASGIGTIAAACSLRDEDGREDLRCVHVPTGIFHGEKDEVVPFELGELQYREISCARLFPFADSGHAVFYDELDEFNRSFLDFIR